MGRELEQLDAVLVRRWLEQRGYRIETRVHGWHECRIVGAGEDWLGRGSAEVEAWLAALRAAFPSGPARAALCAALALEPRPPDPVPEPGPAAAPAPDESEPAPSEPPTPPEPPALASASEQVRPTRAIRRLEPRSAGAALTELKDLQAEIARTGPEVALWNGERQRLQILTWIASARALEDAAPHDVAVSELVHAIASGLSDLSGRWWAGSVRALQMSSYPAEGARDLSLADEVGSWLELAEAAAGALEELAEREEREGADEDGWFDEEELEPPHPNPESALREARNALEKATGPLSAKADRVAPAHAGEGAKDEFVRLAKQVRWIRRSVRDGSSWAAVVGRLRWLAQRRGEHHDLARWLNPRLRPPRSWAHELGFDPEKRARGERRRELLRRAAGPDFAPDEASLRAWLLGAFECTPELDDARIAGLLQPHAARVLSLDPQGFSQERRHRKHLKRVKELLGGAAGLPTREEVLRESLAGAEPEPVAAPVQAAGEALLAAVLPRTRGLRVLLVSNRADEHQDETLKETFAFAELDHEVASPRRLQSLVERIESHSYDLVLSATGFQGHTVEGVLRPAAVRSGVPYVRANRARRLACIRALARDLPGRSGSERPAR